MRRLVLMVLSLGWSSGMVVTSPGFTGHAAAQPATYTLHTPSPAEMGEVRREMARHRARRLWLRRELAKQQGLTEQRTKVLKAEMDQHLVALAELEEAKCRLWRRAKMGILLEKRALRQSLRGWQGSQTREERL